MSGWLSCPENEFKEFIKSLKNSKKFKEEISQWKETEKIQKRIHNCKNNNNYDKNKIITEEKYNKKATEEIKKLLEINNNIEIDRSNYNIKKLLEINNNNIEMDKSNYNIEDLYNTNEPYCICSMF